MDSLNGRVKRAARDTREAEWWETTKQAFEVFRRGAPMKPDGVSSALGSRQAGFAAEAAYVQLDDAMQRGFDYDTGHQRFAGTTVEVLEQTPDGYSRVRVGDGGLVHASVFPMVSASLTDPAIRPIRSGLRARTGS
jgi:hypothetical protein